MNIQLINSITALLGIIILSEALILFAGMNILKIGEWSWINPKNNLFLALDFFGGGLVVIFSLLNTENSHLIYLFSVLLFHLATHLYRAWEAHRLAQRRFCNVKTLILFNRIKIVGLVILMALLLLQHVKRF